MPKIFSFFRDNQNGFSPFRYFDINTSSTGVVRGAGNAYNNNSLEPWGDLPRAKSVFPAKVIKVIFYMTSAVEHGEQVPLFKANDDVDSDKSFARIECPPPSNSSSLSSNSNNLRYYYFRDCDPCGSYQFWKTDGEELACEDIRFYSGCSTEEELESFEEDFESIDRCSKLKSLNFVVGDQKFNGGFLTNISGSQNIQWMVEFQNVNVIDYLRLTIDQDYYIPKQLEEPSSFVEKNIIMPTRSPSDLNLLRKEQTPSGFSAFPKELDKYKEILENQDDFDTYDEAISEISQDDYFDKNDYFVKGDTFDSGIWYSTDSIYSIFPSNDYFSNKDDEYSNKFKIFLTAYDFGGDPDEIAKDSEQNLITSAGYVDAIPARNLYATYTWGGGLGKVDNIYVNKNCGEDFFKDLNTTLSNGTIYKQGSKDYAKASAVEISRGLKLNVVVKNEKWPDASLVDCSSPSSISSQSSSVCECGDFNTLYGTVFLDNKKLDPTPLYNFSGEGNSAQGEDEKVLIYKTSYYDNGEGIVKLRDCRYVIVTTKEYDNVSVECSSGSSSLSSISSGGGTPTSSSPSQGSPGGSSPSAGTPSSSSLTHECCKKGQCCYSNLSTATVNLNLQKASNCAGDHCDDTNILSGTYNLSYAQDAECATWRAIVGKYVLELTKSSSEYWEVAYFGNADACGVPGCSQILKIVFNSSHPFLCSVYGGTVCIPNEVIMESNFFASPVDGSLLRYWEGQKSDPGKESLRYRLECAGTNWVLSVFVGTNTSPDAQWVTPLSGGCPEFIAFNSWSFISYNGATTAIFANSISSLNVVTATTDDCYFYAKVYETLDETPTHCCFAVEYFEESVGENGGIIEFTNGDDKCTNFEGVISVDVFNNQ